MMDGRVAMHVSRRRGTGDHASNAGDIFYAEVGCEHVAHPQGAARILVIERRVGLIPPAGNSLARRFIAGQTQHRVDINPYPAFTIYLILVCHSLHPSTIFAADVLTEHNSGEIMATFGGITQYSL